MHVLGGKVEPRDSQYLGWGGKTKHVTVDLNLGMGTHRRAKVYGLRRMVWAAAMGYVSGFQKRDILYYLLTRCVSPRISQWAMEREGIEFVNGIPKAKRGTA
jgi:hypothetical protein